MNPHHKKLFERKYGPNDSQPFHQDHSDPYLTNSTPQVPYDNTSQQSLLQPAYQQAPTTPSNPHLQELSDKLATYNSSKLIIRTSSDYFPTTKKLQKSLTIPLAVTVQPYAYIYSPEDFPTVDFETNAIVRCDTCRSYTNPFTEFPDNGYRYKCNICTGLNPTPHYYVNPTDNTSPGLCCGTYDVVAGTPYMARPAMRAIYLFMIDVSQKAMENGSIQMFSNTINEMIMNDLFWGGEHTRIGFVAFDSNVHVFNLDPKLKRAQVITLTDIDNLTRLPVPDNLMVPLQERKEIVQSTIKAIPKMFKHTKDNGSSLYNAIRVGNGILKGIGGRLYIIQSNPNVIDEVNLGIKVPVATKDKKTLMAPTSSRLTELTNGMQEEFISCNMFTFSSTYKNIITLGELARNLGGDLHYFPEGSDRNHRFYYELKNSVMREYAWETVLRMRISKGWKIKKIYGNYSTRLPNDLLCIPTCDESQTLVYEVELEDEVFKSNVLYLQTALLYTSGGGQRKIRVSNYGVMLSDSASEIESHIDPQVLVVWLLRNNLEKMYIKANVAQIREECIMRARMIWNQISKHKQQNEGLSDSMATFSLGVLGLMKHPLFIEQQWQYSVDSDRMNALRIKLNMLNIDETMLHFVPYLFAVHRLVEDGDVAYYDEHGGFVYPPLLNLSMSGLTNNGIYLMDDGYSLYMYIGSQVDPRILKNVIGISSIQEVESLNEDMLYHTSSDPLVERLYYLITELRNRKVDKYAYLYIIKEGEQSPREIEFYSKLIEDKLDIPTSYKASYADFVHILSIPVVGTDKI